MNSKPRMVSLEIRLRRLPPRARRAAGQLEPTQMRLAILARKLGEARDELDKLITNPAWIEYFGPQYRDDTNVHQLHASDEDDWNDAA